jgi:hypothetical protein
MQDIQSQIRQLKRPGLLVQAARFGLDGFRRSRDLARLLPDAAHVSCGAALMALLEAEREENDARTAHSAHSAHYALIRHIQLLTAIMAEARNFEIIARPRSVT